MTNLLLLLVIDLACLRWPAAHIPFLSREDSLLIVALLNAAVITHVIMTRLSGRLAARRIATTWCASEQSRFFESGRL